MSVSYPEPVGTHEILLSAVVAALNACRRPVMDEIRAWFKGLKS